MILLNPSEQSHKEVPVFTLIEQIRKWGSETLCGHGKLGLESQGAQFPS